MKTVLKISKRYSKGKITRTEATKLIGALVEHIYSKNSIKHLVDIYDVYTNEDKKPWLTFHTALLIELYLFTNKSEVVFRQILLNCKLNGGRRKLYNIITQLREDSVNYEI